MSKLADRLREAGYINLWSMTTKGQPCMSFRPARHVLCSNWHVSIKGYKVKGAAWYENDGKSFSYCGKEGREEARQEALAWIKKHFPDAEMVKCPLQRMSYTTKADLDAAMAKIKENE